MQDKAKQNNHTSRRALLLTGIAAATLSLTGCPVLFVGGVAAGVMTAVDRRSTGTQVEDKGIALRVSQEIHNELGDRGHVNVNSYNRQVLLTGEVPTAEDWALLELAVARVANVNSLVNFVAIGPNTSMSVRSNDTYLTGKVKTALATTNEISASDVKVVTERGAVYLMGIVSEYEARIASDVASRVIGVKKVVQVFEIVSEEELASINSRGTQVEPGSAGNENSKP